MYAYFQMRPEQRLYQRLLLGLFRQLLPLPLHHSKVLKLMHHETQLFECRQFQALPE
jgi:hypothetical protein